MSEASARSRVPAPGVVNALWTQGQGRLLARELSKRNLQALALSGPEVQQRLFGTPAAHPSSCLDILARPGQARQIRAALTDIGYSRHPSLAPLGPSAGLAVSMRSGHVVRLRWRAILRPLPGPLFGRLRDALWRQAVPGAGGFHEPRIEPLLVYLAVEAVRGPGGPVHSASATAAAALVDDWPTVWAVARSCRVTNIVRNALGDAPALPPALDGVPPSLDEALADLADGRHIPEPLRQALIEHISYRRQGLRVFRPRIRRARLGQLHFDWWEGVCGPGEWSDELVRMWLESVADLPRPVLVEVGTGTGALAIDASIRRPDADVRATDISFRAVGNTRANVDRLGVPVSVYRGDLLRVLPHALRGRVDGVVAHLPSMWLGGYLDEEARAEGMWAPRETYEGQGGDGLDLFRRLMSEAPEWLSGSGRLVISMQGWQWQLLRPEATAMGYRLADSAEPSETGVIVALAAEGSP